MSGYPSFRVITPLSAFAASKFHLVLHNDGAAGRILRLQLLVLLNDTAAVVGALSGIWTLRRRVGPTTPPSGAGGIAPIADDPVDAISAGIGAWNAPGTPPAGGVLETLHLFYPQPDEIKLTTIDAPTQEAGYEFGGRIIYDAARIRDAKPITIRGSQTLEVQQDATAGLGNVRVLAHFTERPQ